MRVALLNGEPIFFDCLKLLFKDSNFVVVRSFDQTLDEFDQIATLRPDIVLCDNRSASELDTLAERLDKSGTDVPMVFIRLDAADPAMLRLLDHPRPSGFVSLTAASATLLTALEIVSKGGHFVDPALKAAVEKQPGSENVIPFKSEDLHPESDDALSEREREVLYHVALGNSSKEIAAKMDLSCKTVETYKSRATQKLNLTDRPSVVRYALAHEWFNDLVAELKEESYDQADGRVA